MKIASETAYCCEQHQEIEAAGKSKICRAVKVRSAAAATTRQIYVKK
ncbi:MAG: hypothetical protein MUE44_28500 [Oscillatoriaceae cyanobacterium Prado104]|nr:hypothetical protein [Oscillatoriaceae cyanobacterium Prado104]